MARKKHKFDERKWQQDRHSAYMWAKGLFSSYQPGQIILLDTETTDFDGELVELAIIDISGEALFNGRFKPQTPIAPGAEQVHGLSAAVLADEPDFAARYDEIRAIVEGALLTIIYNSEFDLNILLNTCKMRGLPPLKIVSDCAMLKYAAYKGRWRDDLGSYKWLPLPEGDHSAIGDCRSTLGVVMGMADKP